MEKFLNQLYAIKVKITYYFGSMKSSQEHDVVSKLGSHTEIFIFLLQNDL